MKQFLSSADVPQRDELLRLAQQYKRTPLLHEARWKGKRLGLLFFNPSLRTRLSTQIAAEHLGMNVWTVNAKQDLWNLEFELHKPMNGETQEHIIESVRVMSAYCDILGIRTFPGLSDQQADDEERILSLVRQHAHVPLLSLESATLHPLQSLADVLTIQDYAEKLGRPPKVVLSWAPHVKPIPQCVANSLCQWMRENPIADFSIAHPKGYALNPKFTQGIPIHHHQEQALADADIVYVKNWSAYAPYASCPAVEEDWMLSSSRLEAMGNRQLKVMHCLPVRRDVELGASLLDSTHSLVNTQATYRIFAAQAVLHSLLSAL